MKEAIRSPATGTAGETGSRLHRNIREDVWRAVVRAQDREHGGLGDAPKFPMFDVMELALDVYLDRHNPSALAWLLLTADNMLSGGTYDREEGGLFRYSTTRDWSVPHFEKMLADNARMARILLRLWLLNGKQLYAGRAAHILDYVDRTLGDGKGGFYGSQDADEHYYVLDLAARAGQDVPFVDHTVYVDSEALAVEAFLEAGEILGRARYRELGRAGLRLLTDLLSDETGMPHYLEDRAAHGQGLLEDQATTLSALLKGFQLTGDRAVLEKAAVLGDIIRTRYWDSAARVLADIDRRTVPVMVDPQPAEIATASQTAGALLALGELTGRNEMKETAREILEAYSNDYLLFSFHAAPYARAADLQLSGFRTVMLRGEGRGAEYAGLRRAALLSPLPRLLIIPGGNNLGLEGKASNAEGNAEGPPGAFAVVCEDNRCGLAIADAETLAEALEVNRGLLGSESVE